MGMRWCTDRQLDALVNLLGGYGTEPERGGVYGAVLDLAAAREIVMTVLACDECKTSGLCKSHRGKLGRIVW